MSISLDSQTSGCHSPTMTNANTTLDLGNNEQISRGVFPQADGSFLAMTFTQSKTLKTREGAERWLARKSGK